MKTGKKKTLEWLVHFRRHLAPKEAWAEQRWSSTMVSGGNVVMMCVGGDRWCGVISRVCCCARLGLVRRRGSGHLSMPRGKKFRGT